MDIAITYLMRVTFVVFAAVATYELIEGNMTAVTVLMVMSGVQLYGLFALTLRIRELQMQMTILLFRVPMPDNSIVHTRQ